MSFELTTKKTKPEVVFKKGTPDVDEAIRVSEEALDVLGFQAKGLREDYEKLADLGYDGRLYPALASAALGFDDLLRGADGKRPQGVQTAWRYKELWAPEKDKGGYTEAKRNGTAVTNEGQLALFNTKSTGFDPLLHGLGLLGLPFDTVAKNRWNPDAEMTQLELIDEHTKAFEAQHEVTHVKALGARAVLMMALMDRVRGIDPQSKEFILNAGFMRDSELGRVDVSGVGSLVGIVDSGGSRLRLSGSLGGADSSIGVGFSAGRLTES